jgi:hypothetical protein
VSKRKDGWVLERIYSNAPNLRQRLNLKFETLVAETKDIERASEHVTFSFYVTIAVLGIILYIIKMFI